MVSLFNNKRNIITGLLRRSASNFFRKDVNLAPRLSASKDIKYSSGLYGPQSQKTGSGRAGETSQLDAASAAPMHSLVVELQAFISQAGKDGMEKDELHPSLKKLLQKYPSIKGSVFENGEAGRLLGLYVRQVSFFSGKFINGCDPSGERCASQKDILN